MIENALLAGLSDGVRRDLTARGLPVPLEKGQILGTAEHPPGYVYFPLAGLVSIVGLTASGGTVELAAVARDGSFGPATLRLSPHVPHQATVRLAGAAVRIDAEAVRSALAGAPSLRGALSEYADRRSAELAHSVICQCYHTVLQRLCRWLLTAADRTRTETLEITQESLGEVLGVVRPVVTRAALELQDALAIRSRRGRVTILDRPMLKRSACECYHLVPATASAPPVVDDAFEKFDRAW